MRLVRGHSLEGRQARLEGGQWQEWAMRDLVTSGISLEVSVVSEPARRGHAHTCCYTEGNRRTGKRP